MTKGDFPFKIKVGFKKLIDQYEVLASSDNDIVAQKAQSILAYAKEDSRLIDGYETLEELSENKVVIEKVTEDLFTSVLEHNEIKFATLPFQEIIFKSTQRFKNIINEAGAEYVPTIQNFDEDHYYIMGCSIILNLYYGFQLDFRRPFYYEIPDERGLIKTYRILYNGDFIELEKTENAKEITDEDVADLLDNFENIDIWKEKFPPHSWIFKGFVIANLIDVTADAAISSFKTFLLNQDSLRPTLTENIEEIFRNLLNLPELKVGFTDFNEEDDTFERMLYKNVKSFILDGKKTQVSREALCDASYYTLFKKNEYYCISDTERYHRLYPENILYKKLLDQNIKSAILVPVVQNGNVIGLLELVSYHSRRLNSIKAHKLRDVMPFLEDAVIRAKEAIENELELIIQEECTSIHKSVHWKFRREAKRYVMAAAQHNPVYFREIVFEDVYPLYGQMDIKGSSTARNTATVLDLKHQLSLIKSIVKSIAKVEKLPIYDQINFRITRYLDDLLVELQVDSERQVLNFLQAEVIPLFAHLRKKDPELKALIDEYYLEVDKSTGLIYKHRKDYDDTVMTINKKMAAILDKKQIEAQKMYPHYYERYKTDGVEHNLYIGESITKKNSFHKVYLYNLRLWQLQAMCEMENQYYKLKEHMAVELDVASMILVFNSSLSLRFRMDEKRFDVDGTYNARYEVVKKRVDKANIKGTDERATQAGKITIIYSQEEDEIEYRRYIGFLQTMKQLDDDLEFLDLEDLQGVTGLKALRISVLYSKGKENAKEYYTYEDLVDSINA
ncbi:hypothetical protein SCB49_12104 [unidentified eubacterium SCB49]|nr:hypothetical protein SCB49_12104 [unidentified eubacterium SCB49]